MAFDPLDFLITARQIANSTQDESELRTAVGRAYYAAFLVARDKFGITSRHRVHDRVRRELRNRHKTTGDKLASLFYLRKTADYKLEPTEQQYNDWSANWKRADRLASEILPRIENL